MRRNRQSNHRIRETRLALALVILSLFFGLVPVASPGMESERSGQLVYWGCGFVIDNNCPRSATAVSEVGQVRAIAAGRRMSAAVSADGKVWTWSNTPPSSPQPVSGFPAGLKIHDIKVGGVHFLALGADGTVWAWGGNVEGQLGDGTTNDRTTPERVKDPTTGQPLKNIIQVAAGPGGVPAGGSGHSLALAEDGTIWAWGPNDAGQLGNGVTSAEFAGVPFQPVPVQVSKMTGLTKATRVAAGGAHSLALHENGSVWAWGANGTGHVLWGGGGAGQAPGTVGDVQPLPHQVPGVPGVSSDVAAGGTFSLALNSDGTVWSWGANLHLGNPEPAGSAPRQVVRLNGAGPLNRVRAITAGPGHALALQSEKLWGWGNNSSNQVGGGMASIERRAVEVTALAGVALAVAAGEHHSLAVKGGGPPEAQINPAPADFVTTTLAASRAKTLMVTNTGEDTLNISAMKITGDNASDFNVTSDECVDKSVAPGDACAVIVSFTPQEVGPRRALLTLFSNAPQSPHTIELTGKGRLYTEPADQDGKPAVFFWGGCGREDPKVCSIPRRIEVLKDVQALGAGYRRIVVLNNDGSVWTLWHAEHCNGNACERKFSGPPARVQGLPKIKQISVGRGHTLAVSAEDGGLWAWGENDSGQLGDGTNTDRPEPVRVMDVTNSSGPRPLGPIKVIAAGDGHSLALEEGGRLWAWGRNDSGQLGNGSYVPTGDVHVAGGHVPDVSIALGGLSPAPVSTATGLGNVVEIDAGGGHSLARTTDGAVWAWGANDHGQLGQSPEKTSYPEPVQVPNLSGIQSIATGAAHTAALSKEGTIWAWGRNGELEGSLGNGSTTGGHQPTQVVDPSDPTKPLGGVRALGRYGVQALTDDALWAWGRNSDGQLGNGEVGGVSLVPVRVLGLSGKPVSAGLDHILGGVGAALVSPGLGASVEFSPEKMLFRATSTGSRRSEILTLTNVGNIGVRVSTGSIDGPDHSSFAVDLKDCVRKGVIQPESSCKVAVSFLPSKVGDHWAALSIITSPLADGQKVPLQGFGDMPACSLDGQPAPAVNQPRPGEWKALPKAPAYRMGAAVAAGANGCIYVMGGATRHLDHEVNGELGAVLSTVEAFDPRTDRWESVAQLNIPRLAPAAASDSRGRLYVFGGIKEAPGTYAEYSRTAERYDPKSNRWEMLALPRPDLIVERAVPGVDGLIYVTGLTDVPDGPPGMGTAGARQTNIWTYDPVKEAWSEGPQLTKLEGDLAAGMDRLLYAFRGQERPGVGRSYEDSVDPDTGSWTPLPPLPTRPRYPSAVSGLDGNVYAISGFTDWEGQLPAFSDAVDAWDPCTQTWSSKAPIPLKGYTDAVRAPDGLIYATSEQSYRNGWEDRGDLSLQVYRVPDEGLRKLTVTNAEAIKEPFSGSVEASFTVKVEGPPACFPISVDYATASGSATEDQDYEKTAGRLEFKGQKKTPQASVTIEPGETQKTFSVKVNADSVPEPTEEFFVRLSNPSAAVLKDAEGKATILDADPGASVGDTTVAEPDAGSAPAKFTVTLGAPAPADVSVSYATKDGTAKAGQDYEAASGSVEIKKGQTTAAIEVKVKADGKDEPTETFDVELKNPQGVVVLRPKGQAVILDSKPGLSVGDAGVVEGNSGITPAHLTVTLNKPAEQTVKVAYETQAQSATQNDDFQSASGLVGFAPGENSKVIVVNVVADTVPEPTETFSLVLKDPQGAALTRSEAAISIFDDDLPAAKGPRVQNGLQAVAPLPFGQIPPPSTITSDQAQQSQQQSQQGQQQAQQQSQSQQQSQTQAQTQLQAQVQAGLMMDHQMQVQFQKERLDRRERAPEYLAAALSEPPRQNAAAYVWLLGMGAFGAALGKVLLRRAEPARAGVWALKARRRKPGS